MVRKGQTQAGQLSARLAAQTQAGQLDCAQEAWFGKEGLGVEVPGRLPFPRRQRRSQLAQQAGACLGKAVAHSFEREQRIDGKWILSHRACVGLQGLVSGALLFEYATSPVVSPAGGVVDLLARETANVLIEPSCGLVQVARMPGGKGQAPQGLAGYIALGIPVGQIAQALFGAIVVASIGEHLGRTQAGIVGKAVLGKLGLDAGVEREGLVTLARSRQAARSLIERAHHQVAVLRALARGFGFGKQRRRARALALLPHRLSAVKARHALGGHLQSRRGQGCGKGRLGGRVLVLVEQGHATRSPFLGAVSDQNRPLFRACRLSQALQTLLRAIGPGFLRRLGPDSPESRGDLFGRALQLLHGLGQAKLGFGPAWSGREPVEKTPCFALYLGPTLLRDQGVNLDQHRLGLGHGVDGHAGHPGERTFGIASS